MKKKANGKPARKVDRPVWKGFLKFGLVSIPVKAFTAKAKEGGEIELHWLHAKCHSPIHYRKVCPVHGEVTDEEIVSGYEYSRGKYVVIEPEELAKLRRQRTDTIEVMAAVLPDAIDDMYYTDKTYYLVPDGEAGANGYSVFLEAMTEQQRYGVGQLILFRREHLMALRPVDGLLTMTALKYAEYFKSLDEFKRQVPEHKPSSRELSLAKTLIDQLTVKDFDWSAFKDPYTEKLHELIEAKVKGHELEIPEKEEQPVALDFMEALQKSLASLGKKTSRSHGGRGMSARKRKVS